MQSRETNGWLPSPGVLAAQNGCLAAWAGKGRRSRPGRAIQVAQDELREPRMAQASRPTRKSSPKGSGLYGLSCVDFRSAYLIKPREGPISEHEV